MMFGLGSYLCVCVWGGGGRLHKNEQLMWLSMWDFNATFPRTAECLLRPFEAAENELTVCQDKLFTSSPNAI